MIPAASVFECGRSPAPTLFDQWRGRSRGSVVVSILLGRDEARSALRPSYHTDGLTLPLSLARQYAHGFQQPQTGRSRGRRRHVVARRHRVSPSLAVDWPCLDVRRADAGPIAGHGMVSSDSGARRDGPERLCRRRGGETGGASRARRRQGRSPTRASRCVPTCASRAGRGAASSAAPASFRHGVGVR